MKQVKFVDIVLENCESIRLSSEQIGIFCCNNIVAQVARVACNSISKHLICEWMCIELYSSSNQKYDSFSRESELTVFERLRKFNDITAVEVTYEDGSADYILVPWNAESDYSNKYQTSYIASNNRLRILVSKKSLAENFFTEDGVR